MGTYEFSGSAVDADRLRAAFESWLSDPSGRFVVDVCSSDAPVIFDVPGNGDRRRIDALKALRLVCGVTLRDASSMLDGDRVSVPRTDLDRFAADNCMASDEVIGVFEHAGCRRATA